MTRPGLTTTVEDAQGLASVVLADELDIRSEPQARAALQQALTQAPSAVLDLRGLEFIDSSGVKLVLVAQRRAAEQGVAFSVVRGAAHIHRPFSSAGLDDRLPFVDGPPT